MNRLTVVFLCLMLCLVGTTMPSDTEVSAADTVANRVVTMTIGSKIFKIDDVDCEIDTGPQIKWNRTFLPVAPIIDALDGTSEWDARTRSVSIFTGARTVVFAIGSHCAVVNGKSVPIDNNPDLVPYIQAPGRTMLPVRFIAEQFGAVVTWTSTLQRVTLALQVTSPPLSLAQRVVSFTPRQTAGTFLALLRDASVDVIELNGTYHLPYMVINIDRTRPILVRSAAGATAILSGANIGTDPQFWFGLNGTAGNITMQGLIFDGFILGQQGIIYALDCHDITLNDMVVRNSRANSSYAEPYQAWAIYVSSNSTSLNSTVHSTNFTANRWTIDGSSRGMSGLQVYGGSHITATGWSVSNAYYAVYASSSRGPLTDFVVDGWTISNTGAPAWGMANVSVAIENTSGIISNMRTTTSGILLNMGSPRMTDGGGNSQLVVPLGRSSNNAVQQT